MIGCHFEIITTEDMLEVTLKCGSEMGTTICNNSSWYTKVGDPVIHKGTRNDFV